MQVTQILMNQRVMQNNVKCDLLLYLPVQNESWAVMIPVLTRFRPIDFVSDFFSFFFSFVSYLLY